MKKPQHTPGPWKPGDKTDNWWKIYSNDQKREVAIINTIHSKGNRERYDFDIEEANTRLIAKAPELLESLKIIVALNSCNYDRDLGDYRQAMRQAKDIIHEIERESKEEENR